MPGKTASILAAALLLLAGTALPGRTASLDKDACNKLKTEQDGLEKGGVRALMAKGPEWAKANLPAGKLDEVRRTIELDEQLLFRCAGKPLVVLPPEADPAAIPPPEEKPPAKSKDETKVPVSPPEPKAPEKVSPQRKAAMQKEGVKSDAEPAKPAAEETAAKGPKPKAKPKAKQKQDAYKPADDALTPFWFN